MTIVTVSDKTDLFALIELVKNSDRIKPVCVISNPASASSTSFDLEELERQAGDLASFYVVPTGDFTWQFADALGSKASVFNGAAKVFSGNWAADDEWPKLFYCLDKFQDRDTQTLIDHIWKFASDKDLEKYLDVKATPEKATLSMFLGSRAFVKLSSGYPATVRQELTAAGIPLEWLFKKGAVLQGKYNQSERLFLPTLNVETLPSLVDKYGYGNLVLVLVKTTERKKGSATIYPGLDVPFELAEISGNDRDLVTDFLEPGQVVAMRLYRDSQGRTRLKMNDIDDDEEPVEAIPVVNGGPSWLLPERDIELESEVSNPTPPLLVPEVPQEPMPTMSEVPTSTSPIPKPGTYTEKTVDTSPMLTGGSERLWKDWAQNLLLQIESLNRQLKVASDGEKAAVAERESLKRHIRENNRANTTARRKSAAENPNRSNIRSRRDRWSRKEDWFNEELRRVWISRYKPEERNNDYPLDLSKYSYGPVFFESVLNPDLTEDELRKAVRVIVDITTGRESDAHQNRVHQLRESDSPSAPQRTRPDGSKAWRANIEDNTPQARRLHYWKDSAGRIELSKVTKHDDFSA
jgi:hypothetical protein